MSGLDQNLFFVTVGKEYVQPIQITQFGIQDGIPSDEEVKNGILKILPTLVQEFDEKKANKWKIGKLMGFEIATRFTTSEPAHSLTFKGSRQNGFETRKISSHTLCVVIAQAGQLKFLQGETT
mmetsp:Transcript_24076/g.33663  ORF Transcript_24076/g.33663 Transcript_24076/m.33663 type:complete len:123 (-) Transcript_24076:344-712(-)